MMARKEKLLLTVLALIVVGIDLMVFLGIIGLVLSCIGE